jgi:uncharacterized radical SAM superfamily Fe-S cluster-containing enzyme
VQLGLSGGEPLMRDDCEVLAAEATKLGYYVNLITSDVGLTEEHRGVQGRRPRADTALVPGFHARAERSPLEHPYFRAEVEGPAV